ncbi:hypothetical protein [Tenacibaculum sp. SDUM215027]|uniref:hypothetical protein n=1 Tax=Tenacibaculum sp. SDUM215027 TaxID=3422596 RepID=UPI003D31D7AD
MKKYIILSLITLCFSCQNRPDRDKNIIDLENFDLNFNVEEFYSKYIEEIKQTYYIQDIEYDDSIVGTWYRMIGLLKNPPYAYYEDKNFNMIDIIKSDVNKNEFMALLASNYKIPAADFNKLLKTLTNKYEKPQICDLLIYKGHTYTWILNDRLIVYSYNEYGKPSIVNETFYIINKKYIPVLKKHSYSGEWYFLNPYNSCNELR